MLRNSELSNSNVPWEASFERAVYHLFQIDIPNLITIKVNLAKNFRLQPSEIDRMPFWEYEMFIKEFSERVEEENKEQQEQMDKYHVGEAMETARPGRLEKTMDKMTPKMPDFSNINLGSMKF